jgi:predicted nucleic acid-binding protein
MAEKVVLLDTSILIDFYRKKDKTKSILFSLSKIYSGFTVSSVTQFEIYRGAKSDQLLFWDKFFTDITVIPFNSQVSLAAADLDKELKFKRKQIAFPDLFIAATAVVNNLPCATLNKKHFDRIDSLELI